MKLTVAAWFIGFLFAASAWGGAVTLPSGTPLFEQPGHDSRLVGVAVRPMEAMATGERTLWLHRQHPLARYFWFDKMTLPDGKTCYVQNETFVKIRPDGKPIISFERFEPVWRSIFQLLCAAGFCGLAWEWLARHRRGMAYKASERNLRLAALLVLCRWTLLLYVVTGAGNVIANPADDFGYFQNARSFLDGDFSTPWHFTVGQSILYLPFILATGARHVQEIMVPFSWFSGFLLAPAMLVAGYFIGVKLTRSWQAGFFAMLAWALLPFFFHHNPDFNIGRFEAYWHVPITSFSFPCYVTLIGTGFNAMSDTPSTLTMLLVLTGILYLPGKSYCFFLLALLFGFGCMLRINNIFFVPAFALAAWLRHGAVWCGNPKRLMAEIGIGAVGFLVGFAPQMVVNWYFYGNPLLFSYTRYAAGAHTYFSLAFLKGNLAYYGSVNALAWIAGGCGLLWSRDRELRTLLAWWAVPIILFFGGYSHGTDDPVRFIMTSIPAFLLAAACGFWHKFDSKDWLWFVVPLILVAQLRPNICIRDWMNYFTLSWEVWRPLQVWYLELWAWIPMACLWWHFHRKLPVAGEYGIALAALYLYGNSYIVSAPQYFFLHIL